MTTSLQRPLLLVGCGKMGSAMLSGWVDQNVLSAGAAIVEPMGADQFTDNEALSLHGDAAEIADDFDPEVVVFAVKPQMMADIVPDYRRFSSSDTLFLSIAAGTTIKFFEKILGTDAAIVRAMPNTPAAIGKGITVACPNAQATEAQGALAKILLEAVGEAALVSDEALLDPVTAVSGSGPAYVFLLIECLAEAGIEAGLPEELAQRLALQTVAGAGALAAASDDGPAQLRENVTSPAGTTFEALQVLMAKDDGLQQLMTRAVAAATRRSRELAG